MRARLIAPGCNNRDVANDVLLLCDRSLRELTTEHEDLSGLVRCPGCSSAKTPCDGSETYTRLTSRGEVEILRDAMEMAQVTIPGARSRPMPSVWSAGATRTQHINDDLITVKIAGDPDLYQVRLQLAHEAVHVVMPWLHPPNSVYHWTHEMLAHAFSVEFIRVTQQDYWTSCIEHFEDLARDTSRDEATGYVDAAGQDTDNAHHGGRRFVMARQLRFDWTLMARMGFGNSGAPLSKDELDVLIASLPQVAL